MKKAYIISLLLCLVFLLSACGDATTASAAPSAPSELAAATTALPSVPPETETERDAAERDAEIRGSWDGDVYTNRAFGLQITLPEGFLRSNDYQLAQANALLTEAFLKTDAAELVQASGHLTVMAMTDYKGSGVGLILLPAYHALVDLSDEELFSITMEQMQTITEFEILQMRLDGREKTVLHMTKQESGVELDNYQILFRNDETLTGVLTIFRPKGMEIETILEEVRLFDPVP